MALGVPRATRTLVGLLVALLLVGGCSHEVDITPPKPAASSDHEAGAQDTVERLERWLTGRSTAPASALATPAAVPLLEGIRRNVQALRITDLSLRYVGQATLPTAPADPVPAQDAWAASLDLRYRLQGFDRHPAHLETAVVLVPSRRGPRIVQFGGADERTPLWLQEPLTVSRTRRTLLAVAGPAGRYPRLVRRALAQVAGVLPKWHGGLVVEVPRSKAELDSALLADPEEYQNIAAVTTTADGSLKPGAPVRVFVHPEVFERLRPKGAQVVLTHEATHAATKAPFATMPTWLMEGFADYVALVDTGIPVSRAAGQILDRIRKHGVPRGLPTSADLDPTANGLGATYEEAWLACRFLAEQHGQDGLVRFYRAVDAGRSTREAFRSVLGTTQGRFVESWRADLAHLARVTG